MALRRLRTASRLAIAAAVSLPLAATAGMESPASSSAPSQLAIPGLGPFGMSGIAAGAAGAAMLILRHRRKSDRDATADDALSPRETRVRPAND
jgi:hypothetical protein